VPLGWTLLLLVPGLLLTLVTALWVGLLFGTLCTRFRDLPQIVASFMQIAFFVTPVIYKPELLSDRLWAATHLNPFASFLSLLRDPLLGQVPEATHYWLASAVAFGGLALTIPVFARFRARIAYWL
jgi:ABC-type polysaccharide/polyol phosphate export permease